MGGIPATVVERALKMQEVIAGHGQAHYLVASGGD
jgi:hypothetical protein